MADKDAPGIPAALVPQLDEVVVPRSASPRAVDVEELATHAVARFGDERVVVAEDLADALVQAIAQAEDVAEPWESVSGAGAVVTGSVVSAGETGRGPPAGVAKFDATGT